MVGWRHSLGVTPDAAQDHTVRACSLATSKFTHCCTGCAHLRIDRYTGLTTIAAHERYAVEYGPVLLALVGGEWNSTIDSMLVPPVPQVMQPDTWLEPATGEGEGSLHFKLKQPATEAAERLRWVPYYEVQEEQMEVYPAMAAATEREEAAGGA